MKPGARGPRASEEAAWGRGGVAWEGGATGFRPGQAAAAVGREPGRDAGAEAARRA